VLGVMQARDAQNGPWVRRATAAHRVCETEGASCFNLGSVEDAPVPRGAGGPGLTAGRGRSCSAGMSR
jgi:hypothetical protein